MAGAVQGVGDDRAVSRPCVGVRVSGELRDVEVRGGDDRTMVVDVTARGEDAAAVEIGDLVAELLVNVPVVLLRPHLPVGCRPAPIRLVALADDQILAIRGDLAQPVAHGHPVRHHPRLARHGRPDVEADRAVDGALLDRIPAEDAVLRVHPGAGCAVALLAVGPGRDSKLGARRTSQEEVTVRLVSEHAPVARIVGDRALIGRQIHASRLNSGDPGQRTLNPRHTTGAVHAANIEHDLFHGTAGIIDFPRETNDQ